MSGVWVLPVAVLIIHVQLYIDIIAKGRDTSVRDGFLRILKSRGLMIPIIMSKRIIRLGTLHHGIVAFVETWYSGRLTAFSKEKTRLTYEASPSYC